MECNIQIFLQGTWIDCATVTLQRPDKTGAPARAVLEYDLDYVFGPDGAPLSLAYPVDATRHVLAAWPAFLYDLIPQGNGRKFLLGQQGLADGAAADFALLCAGAFNPIGRIRVAQAMDYFHQHVGRHDASGMAGRFTLANIMRQADVDDDVIDYLRMPVAEQVRQLRGLTAEPHGQA